ncbi:hypothetical protein [Hymenobacter sp. BT190]|uniref:hypothetical protein n=1 Tax=Hymenobacter sp. BT190 TaxID=2763505 RepID=UPI0016511C83|nr:hypothetical protein [Hymenobacter sp. BT190]
MPKRLSVLALLGVLAACGTTDDEATIRTNPANRKPGYFDVKGYLDSQVMRLNQLQPAVEKQVQLRDGRTETTRVTKTDWAKELQIFYQADINKPALRGAYSENIGAPYSNAAGEGMYAYVRKPGIDATVESLTINTLGAAGPKDQLEELTAVIKQDNALFYSEKKVHMRSLNNRLTEYEVRGVQKLAFFDTVRYSVQTRILQ